VSTKPDNYTNKFIYFVKNHKFEYFMSGYSTGKYMEGGFGATYQLTNRNLFRRTEGKYFGT
jgi:hypothetical protein